MPTIDVQVHAYERNHPGRPWVGTLVGPAEMTGNQMVAAMGEVGVDGAILVSPFSMYGYDASYALDVRAKHPGKFGLVKPVDPSDPAVAREVSVPGHLGSAGAHLRRVRVPALPVGHRLDPSRQIADLPGRRRGVSRNRPLVRQRPCCADGRQPDAHLQLVAVKSMIFVRGVRQ